MSPSEKLLMLFLIFYHNHNFFKFFYHNHTMANTHTGSHRIHTGFHKIQKSCGFSRNLYRIPQDSTGSRESCGTKMTEYQRLPNSKEVSLSTRYPQNSTRFHKIHQDSTGSQHLWTLTWTLTVYIRRNFFFASRKAFF